MSDQLIEKIIVRDVPIYRFLQNTRKACDTYADMLRDDLNHHITTHTKTDIYVLILDISPSGMFSLKYIHDILGKLFASLPYVPKMYVAYLSARQSDATLVNLINGMAVKNDIDRLIFHVDDQDKAVDWLLEYKHTIDIED